MYEVKESERHREYAEEHVGHCQVQDQDVLGYPQQLRQIVHKMCKTGIHFIRYLIFEAYYDDCSIFY